MIDLEKVQCINCIHYVSPENKWVYKRCSCNLNYMIGSHPREKIYCKDFEEK